MLNSLTKVIIVDNDADDLKKIEQSLRMLDIPAKALKFDASAPRNKPYRGIRLAFFDIRLEEGTSSEISIITTLANAIKKYISIDNGPYILIFWTSNKQLIPAIKLYIQERESETIPKPISIECLDKTIGTSSNSSKLRAAIKEILKNDVFRILLDYEDSVALAAGTTLKTIFNVVSNDSEKWGEKSIFESNFDRVFSKIAIEAVGHESAKKNKAYAIRKGLDPILFSELEKINLSNIWESKIPSIELPKNQVKFPVDFKISKLNNLYHIEKNGLNHKTTRGIVLKLKLPQKNFLNVIGISKKDFLLKFHSKDWETSINNGSLENTDELILFEISAGCDYVQNNTRLYRYIIGIKTKQFQPKYIIQKADYLFEFPILSSGDDEYKLILNFRFSLGLHPDSSLLGKPLLLIKSDLLNQVAIQYSRHISRLGIIEFH